MVTSPDCISVAVRLEALVKHELEIKESYCIFWSEGFKGVNFTEINGNWTEQIDVVEYQCLNLSFQMSNVKFGTRELLLNTTWAVNVQHRLSDATCRG